MPGPCPTVEQLAAALRGTQSSADDERLGAHLTDCPECRMRLEKMAGGSVWLQARAGKRAGTAPGTSDSPNPSGRSPLLERAIEKLQLPSEPSRPHAADPLLEPGTVLHHFGDYEILEELGRGGMGVVFKARQRSLNRLVALKLILAGRLASETEVRRFRNEAEAAARLDHPGILPVYEIGEHEGRHYFTMKLVEGQPLSSCMADLRSSKSPRDIAGLVAQMARAVHFAHQRGILHRDLKPSNILLDADGQPYLMDFGLAKILENDSDLTQSVAVIGTPNYMAPEVASGQARQVTTAVDVFSLGAILYELLTGHPPFQAATSTQTLRLVLEKDPASPVALNPAVPNDLATICLKCLEKEPARRYASAEHLAQDLELFCHGEPITARPLTAVEQFGRWYRRNKLVFTAASAVVAALVIGLGVSTWMYFREREAKLEQERLRQEAQVETKKAQTEAAKSQQVAQFLQDMLKGVGPSVALGRDTTMLREILDKTAERVGKELTNQPDVEIEMRLTLANTYSDLKLYKQEEQMARESLRLARSMPGSENEMVVLSLGQIGWALDRQGKWKEGEDALREALTMARKLQGNESPDVAGALYFLAIALRERGKLAEAETMFRDALAMWRKLGGNNDTLVANALDGLGSVLQAEHKLAEAEAKCREALAMMRKLDGDESPRVAISLNSLALVLQREGKLTEAEAMFRDALAMHKKLVGSEDPEVATTLENLGGVLLHEGKLAETETICREVLTMRKKLFGHESPYVATSLNDLGLVLQREGKLAEAEAMLRDALAMRKQLLGDEDPDAALMLNNLGLVLHAEHKLAEAETNFRQAVAMDRKVPGEEDPDVHLENLARILIQEKKPEEAKKLLRDRIAEVRQQTPNDPTKLASPVNELVEALLSEHKYAQAEQVFDDVLTAPLLEQPGSAALLRSRANLRARRGEWKAAAADFRRAIALDPNNADSWFRLAPMLVQEGDLAGYREQCRQSLERFATTTAPLAADLIAKSCLILPSSGVHLETVGKMEDLGATAVTNYSYGYWFEVDKGLAQYRLGHFAAALDWSQRGMKAAPKNWKCQVFGQAVRAMAQYKMKQPRQAGITLTNAMENAEAKLPKIGSEDLGTEWIDVIFSRALLREAKALIEGDTSTRAEAK